MAVTYEISLKKMLWYGAVCATMMYAGDSCDVSRHVSNLQRIVQKTQIAPNSVNPYSMRIEAVVKNVDGEPQMHAEIAHDSGYRYVLDKTGRTELSSDQLEGSPVAQAYIDAKLRETLLNKYNPVLDAIVAERVYKQCGEK